jgi:hypothetical protein
MKKGIIVDLKDQYIVVLTPTGEFVKGKREFDHVVGKEVLFTPFEEKKWGFSLPTVQILAPIVALLVLVFSIMAFSSFSSQKVYAYVTIDINPSIELALNGSLEVVDVIAYNNDGSKVLSRIHDWKHKDVLEVSKKIIEESEELGFLTTNQEVIVGSVIVAKDENVLLDLNQKLEQVKQNATTPIEIVQITKEEREEAVQKGVSPTTYVVEKKETQLPTSNRANSFVKEKLKEPNNEKGKQIEIQQEFQPTLQHEVTNNTPKNDWKQKEERWKEKIEKKEQKTINRQEKREQKRLERQEKREQKRLERQEKREQKRLERQEKREQKRLQRPDKKEMNEKIKLKSKHDKVENESQEDKKEQKENIETADKKGD